MARARKRRGAGTHQPSHERWLITYADMITLLMVLFIVLFAISQVDQKRFDELKQGLAAGFGHDPSPLDGARAVMDNGATTPLESLTPVVQGVQPAKPAKPVAPAKTQSERQHRADQARRADLAAARREVARLTALERRIHRALAAQGLADDVRTRIERGGLRISMVSRHIVFAANLASLTPRGRRVLDVLSPVLRELHNQINVDGHTNQVKVKPKYYPTDWELSAARAVTVLRYLHEHGGVPSRHLSAVAFGHERPLVDPALPKARVLNKRVDILVVSKASEDARKLFGQVLKQQGVHARLIETTSAR
ncbi:MAG TPA: flagellar motor protein MotB [Nocardioidaceae bacterium]|nr:flagellar motor protein MotB [Nocardioidaceae bacterium]